MPNANYFQNAGGLNLSDSPFVVDPSQCVGGWNFDYSKQGSIQKSRDRLLINTSPDSQPRTNGLGLFFTPSGTKTVLRMAGTALQVFNPDVPSFTTQSSDDASPTQSFFSQNTPVSGVNFNVSATQSTYWCIGGGATTAIGYYGSGVTTSGAICPKGTLTVTNIGSANGGAWAATGTYYYALACRKKSTQALSNAYYDVSVAIATTTDAVTITFPTIDSTKYDQWYIYRSAVGGVSQFTAGNLVAQVPTSKASFTDTGDIAVATNTVVPRAGGTTDNSILPTYTPDTVTFTASAAFVTGNTIAFTINGRAYSQAFTTDSATTLAAIATKIQSDQDVRQAVVQGSKSITITGASSTSLTFSGVSVTGGASQATITVTTVVSAQVLPVPSAIASYKRRLVVAIGNTLYFSDTNKPESFRTLDYVPIPAPGNITALAVVGFNSYAQGTTDEYLCVFTDSQLYVLTGSSNADFAVKFIDSWGCPAQSLVTNANGHVLWIGYGGVFGWSGTGKPVLLSPTLRAMFDFDGDLDKTKLNIGWCQYFKKAQQVVWNLSHRTKGENCYQLKLDLRATMPQSASMIEQTIINGVFTQGYSSSGLYAGLTYLPSTEDENFLVGDASGYMYKHFWDTAANSSGIDFQYETAFLDQGLPGQNKRYKKVIAYVDHYNITGQLTLQFWAAYRTRSEKRSEVSSNLDENSVPINATSNQVVGALWDSAYWDASNWDDYQAETVPIVFNLPATEGNVEGTCIKLLFKQSDSNTPVVIHGFQVFFEECNFSN